mmetsp:Transcript_2768/g.343  ORF Transcript_2768/g.343 Transcript_2768/m.343 type:complete len:86 (-) Transcript_2768:236-493(-)
MRPKTRGVGAGDPFASKAGPGPGQYDLKPVIDTRGEYYQSKFKNSGACTFSPVRSTGNLPKNGTPGPGSYAIPSSLTRNGSYFVS